MKKPYVWAGIFGGLIIIVNVFGEISALLNPANDIVRINLAIAAGNIGWILLGVFLVWMFFKGKKQEDAGVVVTKPIPGSSGDIVRNENIRNWVISFVVLYEIIGSIPSWVLNHYGTGTLISAELIFDLAINSVLFFLVIQLLRGKRQYAHYILWTVLVMGLVEGAMAYWREGWLSLVMVLVLLPYFIFTTKTQTTRTNLRIANFALLPLTLIVSAGLAALYVMPVTQLSHQESQLEQQYNTQNSLTAQAYDVVLQKNQPTKTDIDNASTSVEKGTQIVDQILDIISQVQTKVENQIPTVAQQQELERLARYSTFMNLNKQQGLAVQKFIAYAATVNFATMSETQATQLNALKQDIDSYSSQISDTAFKLNQ